MFYSIWSNQEATFDCVLQLSYMVRVVVHKGVREEGGGGKRDRDRGRDR